MRTLLLAVLWLASSPHVLCTKSKKSRDERVSVQLDAKAAPLEEGELDSLLQEALHGPSQSEDSIAALKSALLVSPQEAKLYAALGLSLARRKKKDDQKTGVRHMRTALELNPRFPGLHHRLASKLQERTPTDTWARNEAVALYKQGLHLSQEASKGRLTDKRGTPLFFHPEALTESVQP